MQHRWTQAATAIASLALTGAALAQTTVYESQGKNGPVFSDQAAPGAKVVDVPTPNIIQSPKPAPTAPVPATAPAAYRQLSVASPANEGTVHSNTGAFTLKARIDPALRKGDRIRVRLDGQLLPGRYQSTSIALTAADWQAVARTDNVQHSLQLAVEDKSGKVLLESAVSTFYAQRATVKRRTKN